MYIDQIKLKNIRGFDDLEFDLKRPDGTYAGWTVFTGDNGSGKSTLLKAIAIGLVGRDIARSLQPSFKGWIRNGIHEQEASIQLNIVPTDGDAYVTTGRKPGERHFPLKLTFTSGEKEPSLTAAPPAQKTTRYVTPDRSVWATDAKGWFACGYGPFRRVIGASPVAARLMVSPTTERFVTMFQEAASLEEVDQWLRTLNHKKLEGKPLETSQLELLEELLRDDLMPNQITIDRVDSDGLWLKDRNGVQLSWHEMSDGYRSALALLADILRHLINSYGIEGLATQDSNGKTIITRSGVVLIDEIDAHLHPEWQREIGFWLKNHFPNIQFLVTTHSPIICQAADPNGLFVLPEPGGAERPRALSQDEYQKVIASRPDTILLTAAFGLQNTRSPRAVEARATLSKLQAKKHAGAELTREEQQVETQLQLFVDVDEEL